MNSLWSKLRGQSLATELLQASLKQGRIAPGYLFAGPAGVGKSLAARLFAAELLDTTQRFQRIEEGNHPDLIWVEPTYKKGNQLFTRAQAPAEGISSRSAPQVRLEQVRTVVNVLSRPPVEASRQVVVVEGAETMAEAAANGFLKTLEEPGHAVIILLVPDIHHVLSTIVSRCQRIPFYRLSEALLLEILDYSSCPPEILAMAQGSAGQAQELLQGLESMHPMLLEDLKSWPTDPLKALTLARTIDKNLDPTQQLWLVDYLQHNAWEQGHTKVLKTLEQVRFQLGRFIPPRLVWEVALLKH
jgi:DNA polymerase III subunit delta'